MSPEQDAALRKEILDLVARYAQQAHGPKAFTAGESMVPPSGKVYGAEEMTALVDASLDFWLTTGRYNDRFESQLATFLGVRYALTVNSGSSANLLAVAALNSPLLGDRALKPGDEVITAAAGFPTTLNPLIQHGQVPVFVDVDLATCNATAAAVRQAVSPRTRGIMLAHTLGNPFDIAGIMEIAREHDLWVVEDCCDALGATFGGQKVGTFGHIGTLSFYPAHHITMGEGGAVFTREAPLKRELESIRDWGRHCYCPPGKDNTCGKRYDWKLGGLPEGYDHKYIYSNLGYNLKISDMQAAVGVAQMDRLDGFIRRRNENFAYLHERLTPLSDRLILPRATPGSEPSWFGFPITLDGDARGTRTDLLRFLDGRKVGTRLLFAGNLTRQPYMQGREFRVSGELTNTDRIMHDTFWVGIYPGLDKSMLDYTADSIAAFYGGA
ncbi:MAG: lipopolysaccharide biosynthesis protein RfbH [Nitrospirota bacterium]|nr:lipopolysaccharide biosynthesis protein RfbH [Nitrospirota bacterium]